MTYKEKYKELHPDEDVDDVVIWECPGHYFKHAPATWTCAGIPSCEECWDREMEEEP